METFKTYLEIAANVAAVLTAVVAVWFWCKNSLNLKDRVASLDNCLRKARKHDLPLNKDGARGINAIIKDTKMSETRVWESIEASDHVEPVAHVEKGRVEYVLFKYKD